MGSGPGTKDPPATRTGVRTYLGEMTKFLLWLLLLVFCWPVALLALVLYPLIWLLALPFRLVGIAVDGVFTFLHALLLLPARVLGGGARGTAV